MFKKNKSHLQKSLFSPINSLPEKQKKRLEQSWATPFYEEVFCRIDEEIFEILYSDQVSRPNVPVNILVGLEILKQGNDWTDREMYDQLSYNLQVRYALGLGRLDECPFELRTVYNFRKRLVTHMRATGENLIEVCFERMTDEQMIQYEVSSGVQRVDSKQISSNIREGSRLQLLVEVLQRVWRMLAVKDKSSWKERLAPYTKGDSGKFMYRLKGEKHRPYIEQIGCLMAELVSELGEEYRQEEAYTILKRVFGEHFKGKEGKTVPQENDELSASSLQAVDDLEATYRRKQGESYVGYVVNVTETVRDETDGLQLITKVQVAANTTDDATLLAEALPDLVKRTAVKQLYTDGAYCSSEIDALTHEHGISQIPTAIRGATPDSERFSVNNLQFTFDSNGTPTEARCPHGHLLDIDSGRKPDKFIVRLSATACPFCHEQLKQQQNRSTEKPIPIYFDKNQAHLARRRQSLAAFLTHHNNPRAAIEATVRELTCRLQRPKLRVRGLHRVSMTLIASAAMCNLRRIWRHQQTDTFRNSSCPSFGFDSLVNDLFAAISPLLNVWKFSQTGEHPEMPLCENSLSGSHSF